MSHATSEAPLSVLIAGFGDVGHRIASALQASANSKGVSLTLNAIRRQTEAIEGINVLCCDMNQAITQHLPTVDYVIFCVSADQLTEKGYQATYIDAQRHLISALTEQAINVKHYFFCSSTSVYGQTNHEWVDESSITAPTRFTGVKMLEAESVANSAPWPATSIRATGLYGPGRTRMISQVRSGKVAAAEPKCYSNRIHVDDLAAFYAHLILEHHLNDLPLAPLYLASDDTPVAIHEVQEWMARKLGIKELERIPAGRTGSKRISNERMKSTGFQLTYPSYMDGMPKLLTKTME
jgi:nucleoside-diphosphate-sugar epimerase